MLKAVTNLVNVSQITGVLPVVNGGTGVTTSTGTGNTVLSAAPTLSGNVTLSTGNLIISTAGKGIDFSATSGAGTSELLADYEEGTWTPVVNFGGADGGSSYLLQSGYYTKVGNQVTAWCYAEIIAASAATGVMTVSGLPFTATASSNFQALGSGGLDNAALPADQPVARVYTGQSAITMMSGTGINNWATLTDTGVKNNGLRVYATVTYSV